jgi:hypothetical protein
MISAAIDLSDVVNTVWSYVKWPAIVAGWGVIGFFILIVFNDDEARGMVLTLIVLGLIVFAI